MKLSRYLLISVALLGAAAFATTTVLAPLNVATEAILPTLAGVVLAIVGISPIAWVVFNELVGLARPDRPTSARPARFVPPLTGTPEVTAFG